MLRESNQNSEDEIDPSEVIGGLSGGTRINEAEALVGLAKAVVQHNEQAVATARDRLHDALGQSAMVNAVAVAAFHGFVRIAEAIGIPYTTAAQG